MDLHHRRPRTCVENSISHIRCFKLDVELSRQGSAARLMMLCFVLILAPIAIVVLVAIGDDAVHADMGYRSATTQLVSFLFAGVPLFVRTVNARSVRADLRPLGVGSVQLRIPDGRARRRIRFYRTPASFCGRLARTRRSSRARHKAGLGRSDVF